MIHLLRHLDKTPHGSGHMAVSAIGNKHLSLGQFRILNVQLKVDNIRAHPTLTDQRIRDKGDSHSLTHQGLCRHQLIQM